jgi:ribosomal protein S12 methylthiotransferase accessory factor
MVPAFGITRIAEITGLDRVGFPVVSACRPLSKSLSVSQGKGPDLDCAKVSAIFEAIECFHAENVVAPLRLATWNELRGRFNTVNPEKLASISVSTFHPDWKMLWIEGRDWAEDRAIWLPYEIVHLDFTIPLPTGTGAFLMSSNGLGAGGTFDEALSHAISEVIERDAVSIFGLRAGEDRARMRVALDSVDDAGCRHLLERLERASVDIVIWDATSDIRVPCFLAKVVDRSESSLASAGPAVGKGCHPDKGVALFRALAEAVQVRLTNISGAREDVTDRVFAYRDTVVDVRAQVNEGTPRRFSEIIGAPVADAKAEVEHEMKMLKAAGLDQIIVVDLTRREFGIPVVRVVIPGSESLDEAPGYSPGPRARAILEAAGS